MRPIVSLSGGMILGPSTPRLGEIRRALGSPVTLALTATATSQVQQEIIAQLELGAELNKAAIFNSGIKRPNLSLNVHDVYGLDEKFRV